MLIGLIFGICWLNLSLYANEYYHDLKKRIAAFFPPPAKPDAGGSKPEAGKAGGPKPEGGKGGDSHGGTGPKS